MTPRDTAGVVLGETVSNQAERVVRMLSVLPRCEGERIARTLVGSIFVLFPDLDREDTR